MRRQEPLPFQYRCGVCGRGMSTLAPSVVTCRHGGTTKQKAKPTVMDTVGTPDKEELA